jgi:Tol biopolymer transport system component
MRSVFFLSILLLTIQVYPQTLRVRSVKRIIPEKTGSYLLTGIVPGTGQVLVAGEGYNGLSLLDTRKGKMTEISKDPGAGYEPAVTADGRKVIYRSDSFDENLKVSSIYAYDIETGSNELLAARGRGVISPAVAGNSVLLKSDSETRVEQRGPALKSAGDRIFLVIEEMLPVLYRNDERKALSPNGDGFYIWASLSPDGTMILYNYQGRGSFICDSDGKILHDLGNINAPKWFNDKIVIGMDDKDDGHMITSSELVYYSLGDRKRIILTSTPERSEMFPFASGSKKIAFCTDNGDIYLMKVRVR